MIAGIAFIAAGAFVVLVGFGLCGALIERHRPVVGFWYGVALGLMGGALVAGLFLAAGLVVEGVARL